MSATQDLEGLLARKRAVRSGTQASPVLAERLSALEAWQADRLQCTYADLAREPRYAAAVRFFLSDLYGPHEHAARERELERAWQYFKRALPAGALAVLERAVELDVLSAELDAQLAACLEPGPVTLPRYAAAYRCADRESDRRRQIELVARIGEDLDRIVRKTWIGIALKAAHVPAHAAGFGVLQDFLERGYAAFRGMGGADTLFEAVRERETRFMESLLHAEPTRP